jgi:ADP-heptose:LPS heptosyltransferase
LILIHPWPGGANRKPKRWPHENWVELIRTLCGEGWCMAITGAGDDIAPSAELASATGLPAERCFSIAGRFDLLHLASLIRRAALVISVDTGIMQLAAALDARLISLHGPTLSSRWGPRNANAIAIDATHPAAGYVSLGYERHPEADEIMSTIRVAQVLSAARLLLERAPARRGAAPAEVSDPR